MKNKNLLIELNNVNKYFGEKQLKKKVLNNISLHMYDGDFIAITGPSGSGKSTLLSLIGLLDNYQEGKYKLCGQSVTDLSRYQLAILRNKNLGWVFQNFNLISDMTIIENVMIPLLYHPDYSKQQRKKRAEEVLKSVGLLNKKEMYPEQLSGGQQQRVAIARAVVTKPNIILADEPTGNLDSENEEMVFSLLQKLNDEGTTIIMVTHSDKLASKCLYKINLLDGNIVVPSNESNKKQA
jgi:putative ABC transport system ATP-binding protein